MLNMWKTPASIYIPVSIVFTLSLSTFSGSIKFSAFGNSGSKVPVFELSENFLFDPLKIKKYQTGT